jgi:1,4-dihydroxy-2-naphthoate octaprenyltransferase
MGLSEQVQIWASQVRVSFLLLSVLLVLVGGAAAHQDGSLDVLRLFLTMAGVILAHVAVNLYNELSDHQTGIDLQTRRTPFSGGTGNLQRGRTTPRGVHAVAIATLWIAFALGIYLSWTSGWFLMVFVVLGGLAARFYTTHLARWMMGELAAGVCLGTFVVLGTYYAQTGGLTPAVVWLSIPPGILTSLLLLLNEFPDVEADMEGGRRHLVIVLGRRRAALVYTAALALNYLILLWGVSSGFLPVTVLMTLLTLPLALRAANGAFRSGGSVEKIVPALGANVGLVLGTNLLLTIAYFLHP